MKHKKIKSTEKIDDTGLIRINYEDGSSRIISAHEEVVISLRDLIVKPLSIAVSVVIAMWFMFWLAESALIKGWVLG